MKGQAELADGTPGIEESIEVRLISVRYAARDTNLYEFARISGDPLPDASAGAHIDVQLQRGLVRQYSLVNPGPAPSSYIVGVKRDAASRGGSRYMHDTLKVGAILQVSTPRNNFALVEDAPHVVLIAGGIGITPIFAMVERLIAIGRPFEVHYAARSRADAAFIGELQRLDNVHFSFDEETGGKFLDMAGIVAGAPQGAHFYCCGPAPMLAAFEAATAAQPQACVHVEYFTAKSEAAAEGGYILELAKSGREIEVPAGKTILEVLMEAGIDVAYSCTEGICGACETRVISGTPDHRDSILTPQEQEAGKTMMICCSGSKSERLVLDL
ncbi:MAG: hypothetical protein RLZ98_330 [Pseudomonadota bacterium]|jgi:ferredoxin-NADP reductase